MQDRYVGDIGDFVKYGLLRCLGTGKRLGVAWYLRTAGDITKAQDGRYTTYLEESERWRSLDPALFDGLRELLGSGSRTVAAIEQSVLLEGAVFAAEPLDISNVPVRERERWRRDWFGRARAKLIECTLVFADPDNGLYPNARFSYTRKENTKHIPRFEAEELAEGRSAVIYHHNSRFRGGHKREIRHWMNQLPGCTHAYYWRPFSQRTFFVINPDAEMEHRLEEFEQTWKGHGKLMRKT